jgi:TonB family protein
LIIVLVKAGVLRIPASISLQGGLVGEPGIEGTGDSNIATPTARAEAVAVPSAAMATADVAPVELALGSDFEGVEVLPKDPIELLGVGAVGWIGLPGAGAVRAGTSEQFPHRYPLARRAGSAGTGTGEPTPAPAAVARSAGGGGGGNGGDGGGGRPVAASGNRRPDYPAEAKRRKYEGTVWLLVSVREDGSVEGLSVDQSCGYEILDRAAADAVRRWHYKPATENGRPVRAELRQPIEFSLHG